ncbi:MAG: glucans biosynthesis glucosyltransferase MdoH [Devosia sp.]
MSRPLFVRTTALSLAALASIGGAWLYYRFIGADAPVWLDGARGALFLLTSFWLVWGGTTGVLGALATGKRREPAPLTPPLGLTAILVPIYNEDPVSTFSRVAAMNRSLLALGIAERFHFAILSDSTALEVAAQEVVWFEQLIREPEAAGRVFYRHRERNTGKKSGNIEDFISHSGGAYDYALILDADSLMEGETVGRMALRMDADPELGLLQTVPEVIRAETLFGRLMAFSSAYLSPYFARGLALMQRREGPYWGHNAIVRMQAFAASCGLPVLSGKPPYGGHILSHDYVEAALLARAGWKVELDPTLAGSFEEGPENLLEYAKRDRRWCQGNLQHRRLIGAPGLRFWSRFTFVQGIMAYAASPLWLLLLATSLIAAAIPDPRGAGPDDAIWVLAAAVAVALLVPKATILLRGAIDGRNRQFGGTVRVALGVLGEIVLSTLLAPIMLCFQSRAVFEILFGLDGGWPATRRDEARVEFGTAFAASWWIVVFGAATLAVALAFAPGLVPWLLPVTAPAIAAPLLIGLTSLTPKARWLFGTAMERQPAEVMLLQQRIYESWTMQGPALPDAGVEAAGHVLA